MSSSENSGRSSVGPLWGLCVQNKVYRRELDKKVRGWSVVLLTEQYP